MKTQPTVLTIRKTESDTYQYELRRPSEEPFIPPTEQEWESSAHSGAVRDVCSLIGDAALIAGNSGGHAESCVRLRDAGTGLFETLFPAQQPRMAELRKALKSVDTPLLISTNDPEILWELLQDPTEEECFALKYDLGRKLVARHVPLAPIQQRETRRCLLIADPNPDEPKWALPGAAEEARALQRWFKLNGIQCDYLEGKDATRKAVLAKLMEMKPYDIIHYAGHVVWDVPSRQYAFRLSMGDLLTAGTVRTLVKPSPIVFLNACWAGKAKGVTNSLETVQGLTDAFLASGAIAVLGSLFEAPDEGARAFAEKFYELVFSGKALGEAVRYARKHVKGNPEYAAAWACFVLYGNPCLRLEIRLDELERALKDGPDNERFDRSDFSPDGIRIIEVAFEYARKSKFVDTSHLFAALVGSESNFLRDRLNDLGFPAQTLREAFQAVFELITNTKEYAKTGGANPGIKESLKLSSNVRTILAHAIGVRVDGKITEVDILRGFVKLNGGSAGSILREIGLDVGELNPDGTPTKPTPTKHSATNQSAHPGSRPGVSGGTASNFTQIKMIGSLTQADCTPEAWSTLSACAWSVDRTGGKFVGSMDLFSSMIRDPNLPMVKALSRMGLRPPLPELSRNESILHAQISEIACSKTVSDILLEAQSIAAANSCPVTDSDLMTAFVQNGGGQAGEWLQTKNVVPEALISSIFGDDGGLDLSCFTDSAQRILEAMIEWARKKRHAGIARHHFLYGMLSSPNSLLGEKLKKQSKDAEYLADLMRSRLPSEKTSSNRIAATVVSMSPGLVRILCSAEIECHRRGEELVDENDLLKAFMDNSGTAGEFLVQNGVRLKALD